MKKHLALLASLSLAFAAWTTPAHAAAEIGAPAPDFTLVDNAGNSHSLSDFRGRTVVLEWVNPDCPFVVKHYQRSGNMPKLQAAAVADGVVWLLINSAAPGKQGDYDQAKVDAWWKDNNVAATAYLRDPTGVVGRAYGARTTPQMYVITPEGTLVYNGAIDSIRSANAADIARADNYVTMALEALKAGNLPSPATTTPYGCTVKY